MESMPGREAPNVALWHTEREVDQRLLKLSDMLAQNTTANRELAAAIRDMVRLLRNRRGRRSLDDPRPPQPPKRRKNDTETTINARRFLVEFMKGRDAPGLPWSTIVMFGQSQGHSEITLRRARRSIMQFSQVDQKFYWMLREGVEDA